ncbi:MAG: hypothetical protein ACOYIR_01000 [Christensenellales bacterium]|jgi:hypothetical protein
MLDLNANMFYKAKFTITAIQPEDDLLWRIVLHIKNWQTRKWNRENDILPTENRSWTGLKKGGSIVSEDNSIIIKSEYFENDEGGQYWACSITEKRTALPGYTPRQWVTEVGYEQKDSTSAVLSCVLFYRDAPGFVGLLQEAPSLSTPNLIKHILRDRNLHCHSGRDTVECTPQELKTGDWPHFWDRLIDKDRELPYIYVSPYIDPDSQEARLLVCPERLADVICGNAIVFFSNSPDFAEEMKYLCPKEYSCYGGTIRIYYPEIDLDSQTDPYRHRYIKAVSIEEWGSECVLQMLRRALAQNVNFYDSFFRIEECRKLKEHHKRRKRIAELEKEKDHIENEALEILSEEEERRLLLEDCIEALEEEKRELKEENYKLNVQVQSYQTAARKCAQLETALENRGRLERLPDDPESVMRFFRDIFLEKLDFSDDAYKSAKTCKLDPCEQWRVFFALAMEMRELFIMGNCDPYKEFKNSTGIECKRGEGSMTRKDKRLMRQFQTEYDGEIIDIEPHITYPKLKQSIHFGFSEKHQKIIVGHCGEHMENYTTRKVK